MSNRMLVVSRLDFCWAAVGLLWLWPVMPAIRVCPRVQQERSHSSKVSVKVIYQQMPTMDDAFLGGGGAGSSKRWWFNVIYISPCVIWPSFLFFSGSFFFLLISFCCRLAQTAVVCNRVKASLQTSAGLVPSHQRCQQRHRLHRGAPSFLSNKLLSTITQSLICLCVCLSIKPVKMGACWESPWPESLCSHTARLWRSPAATLRVKHTHTPAVHFHVSIWTFKPFYLLSVCSGDRCECAGLQEGRRPLARHPDGELSAGVTTFWVAKQ